MSLTTYIHFTEQIFLLRVGVRFTAWLMTVFVCVVVNVEAIHAQAKSNVTQPVPKREAIPAGAKEMKHVVNRVDELSSLHADFLVLDNDNRVKIISRASKSNIGNTIHFNEPRKSFKLYDVENKYGRWIKLGIHQIPTKFGASELEIGYAKDLATGKDLVTNIFPLSPSSKSGEKGFTDIANIIPAIGKADVELESIRKLINTNPAWASFHPAIHPSGKLIVFASNRPTAIDPFDKPQIGGIDLYYMYKIRDTWTPPQAFDSLINSRGDELFPSFSSAGEIYFSSNGRPGKGKFDLFKAFVSLEKIQAEAKLGKWDGAIALPGAFNSEADDYCLVWRAPKNGGIKQSGYFSSNRGRRGDLDIYSFSTNYPEIVGRVLSVKDSMPISNAVVHLRSETKETTTVKTNSEGYFRIAGKYNQAFSLFVESPNFERSADFKASTVGLGQGLDKGMGDILLQPSIRKQITIIGEMFTTNGAVLQASPKLILYGEDLDSSSIILGSNEGTFSVTAPKNENFYVDLTLPDGCKNTWHYVSSRYAGSDTIYVPMIFAPEVDSIATIQISNTGNTSLSDPPIANLVWYDTKTQRTILLGHELSDTSGLLRIAIPSNDLANCSLVVARKGCIPEIIDLRRERVPDSILLTTKEELYFNAIKIYHPYDQATQDTSLISRKNLERISQFMLFDTSAVLMVASHTDSRGGSEYNLKLSHRRAEHVVAYIRSRTGINSGRLNAVGMGEKNLANQCNDAHPCSEEEHRWNRRTEITLQGLEIIDQKSKIPMP